MEENYSMIEAIASNIIAKRKPPVGIDFGDLVSWGVEGLHKAYNKYDDSKDTAFKTYAYYRIKGEMLDSLRKEWKYRFPTTFKEKQERVQDQIADIISNMLEQEESGGVKEARISVHDIVSNAAVSSILSVENFDDILDENQVNDDTKDMLDILSVEVQQLEDEEKKFIQFFYVDNLTQKEIAQKFNYSPSKICRIHMKILDKLKRRLSRSID